MRNVLYALFVAYAGAVLFLIGGFGGYVLHASYPTQLPQIIYNTPQVVEIPVEVPVEVIRTVEVERIVTATPQLTLYVEIPQSTEEISMSVQSCVDDARIESQPISDMQAGAIKFGTIKRLRWVIQNVGTCIWDGYTWESIDDPLVLFVPYTVPGEYAEIVYDVIAREPMSLRMFLIPPNRGMLLGFKNVNTNDDGAVYIMEVWNKLEIVSPGGYTQQVCGPSG
jgi:hypothetical protein